ncbi:hybrid sensor histidine kinase/response regulator [Allomuricauda sp. ARW1Y1]|jgi:signal transduction histidine kinase/CheY-like chemotaxis protein|uniref:hybrid sensor histidine kinase/response regulator n=1 Tax=Allomuricauda sp. ARW1Y1 TaxID=2663843 RepID=UPI0015CEF0F3|nr:hybrid sensor histidine kinase/response regulator [Muricauda sp. ARW1Y1]NYJ28478.1 signal transduction histidine kinase/CheY-like chemotaxis protein [Muricauda sp. ARW1Y1]
MRRITPPTSYAGISVLFLLWSIVCNAQLHPEKIDSDIISLRSQTSLFFAGEKAYNFKEIQGHKEADFVPLTSVKENLGFSNEYYWLQFTLDNPTEEFGNYYLETARPITDVVELFLVDENGNVKKQSSGDQIPFAKKSVQHRKSIFDIRLKPHEKLQAFLHLKSDGEVVMLPMNLYQESSFFELTYKEQVFYGFFYGILILACIIYLFFFFALRDRAFLYYPLYVLFIALMQFSLDGFFHQYFTPQGGWLSDRAVLLTAFVSLFFFGKYGGSYLDLKKNSPVLHIANQVLAFSLIVGLTLLAVAPSFEYCYPLANGLGILVLAHMIVSIVVLKIKKVKIDPYFIIGISFLLIGFIVFILNNFNAIENSFLTSNGAKFGIGLEIAFLSISMINRIRDLRMQNEQNQLLALQRAEDMNQIKSSFLSNISHELRTPLNLIMAVASSLKEEKQDKELEEKCKMILNSSKNLLGHIEDILDFTVIEKGDQELKEVPFELKPALQRILNQQRKKALAKGLDFTDVVDASLPARIVGDKAKLTQILNHLLDNAIKFTNVGGVEIAIDCNKKGNRTSLQFTIKDTGIGISKEKMSTVFESFTKKSFMDKREFSGLGLGLYIVKTYVDLQEGTVEFASNEPKGTICKLNLNFEIEEDEEILDIVPNTSIRPEEPKACSVLLVEDNKMNQTVVKLLFKKSWPKAKLYIANHGKEALELLTKESFDFILMDLQMPEMDGFETTSIIRSGKASCEPEIPIIVLTADNTAKTRKKIFELGANDLLTKPVNGPRLLAKMQKSILPDTDIDKVA